MGGYDIDRILNDHAGNPTARCPKCGHEQVDLDGFGVLHCDACRYCAHPMRTDGVCQICGDGPR